MTISGSQATRGMPVAEKMDYYTYPEPNTGCWLWGGAVNSSGYGTLRIGENNLLAHRLQWERYNESIPKGMCICHTCDVRACVNPDHLFLGTYADNTRDASKKGRLPRGEKNHYAKITEVQSIAILNDNRISSAIAKDYGLSQGYIRNLKRGYRWKHLQGATP